jgi:hypothetical protein
LQRGIRHPLKGQTDIAFFNSSSALLDAFEFSMLTLVFLSAAAFFVSAATPFAPRLRRSSVRLFNFPSTGLAASATTNGSACT